GEPAGDSVFDIQLLRPRAPPLPEAAAQGPRAVLSTRFATSNPLVSLRPRGRYSSTTSRSTWVGPGRWPGPQPRGSARSPRWSSSPWAVRVAFGGDDGLRPATTSSAPNTSSGRTAGVVCRTTAVSIAQTPARSGGVAPSPPD